MASRTLRPLAGLASAAAAAALAISCGDAGQAKTSGSTPASTSPAVVAPWSDVVVSDVAVASRDSLASLTYRPDGSALGWWEAPTAKEMKDTTVASQTAFVSLDASGKAAAPVVLDRWPLARPTARADGRIDLLLTDRAPTTEQSKLWVRTVDSAGALGPEQQLSSTRALGDGTLAVAPNGAAIAAWVELRTPKSLGDYGEGFSVAVRVALRNAGEEKFGAPRTLEQGLGLTGPIEASIGDDGRFVIAFDGHGYAKGRWGVRAWTGSVATGVRSTAVPLGTSDTSTTLRTAITPQGRAVVAWGTISHGEEPHSPWVIRAATLTASGEQVGRTKLIDGNGAVAWTPDQIGLTTDPTGRATVAWTHIGRKKSETTQVRVATTGANGRFGTPQRVAASQVGGIATRADGTTVLTVGGNADNSIGQTRALLRAPDAASFGTPELLGVPLASVGFDALNDLTGVPAPSFDPASGRPAVAWTVKRGGSAQFVVQRRDRP